MSSTLFEKAKKLFEQDEIPLHYAKEREYQNEFAKFEVFVLALISLYLF